MIILMRQHSRHEGKKLKSEEWCKISWNTITLSHLNPLTIQCELEVRNIIHLQSIVNMLPDAFIDNKKVTKSHILAMNTLVKINVPEGQLTNTIINESKTCRERRKDLSVQKTRFS